MVPRQKEFDRDDVLLKAMMVFRDKGYEATSMQGLVERMGINRFTLYATFKSKDDLFVEALRAYYDLVAIPFFDRLKDSNSGLKVIEAVLMELVSRVKRGVSPNGCLLCNTIAELGAVTDARTEKILKMYLKLVEADFRAAIERAKELNEIPRDVDAGRHAKVLATYSTGLLSVAKILSERESRESVRAMVAAIR
jgi:TetR/AcrR family transcriptional repressor of nem operon